MLLVLRGQALAGKGDLEEAREVFRFLERIERKQARGLIEETSAGAVVTKLNNPGSGWAAFALGRIEIMARALPSRIVRGFWASPLANPLMSKLGSDQLRT